MPLCLLLCFSAALALLHSEAVGTLKPTFMPIHTIYSTELSLHHFPWISLAFLQERDGARTMFYRIRL